MSAQDQDLRFSCVGLKNYRVRKISFHKCFTLTASVLANAVLGLLGMGLEMELKKLLRGKYFIYIYLSFVKLLPISGMKRREGGGGTERKKKLALKYRYDFAGETSIFYD